MFNKLQRDKVEIQKQKLRLSRMKRDAARTKEKKEWEEADAQVRYEKGRLCDIETALREAFGFGY